MQQVQQQTCKACGRILDKFGRKFSPKSVNIYVKFY